MEGDDEIIFSGRYKDFEFGARYGLGKASGKDVAHVLSLIGEKIERTAFLNSGVEIRKVDGDVRRIGAGLRSVIDYLENKKQSELRKRFLEAAGKKTLVPVAESYFFNFMLKRARVYFKVTPSLVYSSIRAKEQKIGNQIMFIGKYKDWMAIKKLSIKGNTKPWEISAILSGINNTVINKSFDFALGDKTEELDALVPKAGRKSYGNLAAALKELDLPSHPVENAYVINKTFENFGYKPYANLEMLSQEYDVKVKKPKGRKAKG